jgi:glycosyltransferase involved in cell wall biosynthesis
VGDVRIVRGIETYVRLVDSLVRLDVPCELRVIGSFAAAEEESRIRALVKSLGLDDRVDFVGRRPPEEIPGLLVDCDIGLTLLHAIGNYRESYPTKMFEYMAAGLPVLASNFKLWDSVVLGRECGRTVDPVDLDGAAGVILDYWRSPALREIHGRNGRRAVSEFYQWEMEWMKLYRVYLELAKI